jgi:hypothetical protein
MKKVFAFGLALLASGSLALGQADEILNLKEKIIELQNKGELGFRNFILCSNILGFASYVPLSEPVVQKDGKLELYYEPVNVFTSKREGLYEIWYTQDMALLNSVGKVLQEWKDILAFRYTAKAPVMDLYATNSLDVSGLAPGKYKFRAVLKDKLRNKEVSKTIDFSIKN